MSIKKRNPIFISLIFAFTFLFFLPFIHSENLLPTDVTILKSADFQNGHFFSVADLLQEATSIQLQKDGAANSKTLVKINGGQSFKNTLILLDGVALNHNFDGEVDLSQIPLSMVDRVEINKGGTSILYGASTPGGSINIITKRPDQKGLNVQLGTLVGRFGTKASQGNIIGRSSIGDFSYAGSRQQSNGYSLNEDSRFTSHFGNFSRSFNGHGFWGLEYFYQGSDIGVPHGTKVPLSQWNGDLEQHPTDENAYKEQLSQHVKGILSLPTKFNGNWLSTLTRITRHEEFKTSRTGYDTSDAHFTSLSFNSSWRNKFWDIGIEKQNWDKTLFPFSQTKSHQESGFIQRNWLGEHALFSSGVRVDHHSQAGNIVSPRFTGIVELSKKALLSASASQISRAPSDQELFHPISTSTIPNPQLHFEKGWGYDLGTSLTPCDFFTAKITGFSKSIQDLIFQDPKTNKLKNEGREKIIGIEQEFLLKIRKENSVLRNINLKGSWTHQKSETSLEDGTGYHASALSSRNIGLAQVENILSKSKSLTNTFRFQSKQYEQMGQQGLKIPSYWVWNLRFNVKIHKANLFTGVDNILGHRFSQSFSVDQSGTIPQTVLSPQPDRTFWAGLNIQFTN